MYQLNNPVRIVNRDENLVLVSIPKVELSIEVNENVADFFRFLGKEGRFCEEHVERYVSERNITNVEDYKELFQKMIELEVIVELT